MTDLLLQQVNISKASMLRLMMYLRSLTIKPQIKFTNILSKMIILMMTIRSLTNIVKKLRVVLSLNYRKN